MFCAGKEYFLLKSQCSDKVPICASLLCPSYNLILLLPLFQIVNGCITNDGDAFLYGATTVYRNFTINSKVGFVAERFNLESVLDN